VLVVFRKFRSQILASKLATLIEAPRTFLRLSNTITGHYIKAGQHNRRIAYKILNRVTQRDRKTKDGTAKWIYTDFIQNILISATFQVLTAV